MNVINVSRNCQGSFFAVVLCSAAVGQTSLEASDFIKTALVTCQTVEGQNSRRIKDVSFEGATMKFRTSSAKNANDYHWRLSAGSLLLDDDTVRLKCSIPGCTGVPANNVYRNEAQIQCESEMAPRLFRALQVYQASFPKEKSAF